MLVILGWFNIYAAVYSDDVVLSIFDASQNSGRQFYFILVTIILLIAILTIDLKFFENFGIGFYIIFCLMLVSVLIFGKEINGAKSWFQIGPLGLQPSEFAKFSTALVLAKILSDHNVRLDKSEVLLKIAGIILFPVALILLQPDAGTALVFFAFVLVLFREGLTPVPIVLALVFGIVFILTLLVKDLYLYIGAFGLALLFFLLGKKTTKRGLYGLLGFFILAGMVYSFDFVFNKVLKERHQNRIMVLFDSELDPQGVGYNLYQSKLAIGSGGLTGKGYLKGTQTKGDFVPEQSTDFIFCTIGEEHGWIGSFFLIVLYVGLILRVIFLAERQKWRFVRVYGYSVACILLMHFALNISMTIGLFPVIGIPLPFFSYGGSSLWSFSILIFILIKLDAHRMQLLNR